MLKRDASFYLSCTFGVWFVCACTTPPPGERAPATLKRGAPLPPDLLAACPEAKDFYREGASHCTMMGCVSGFTLNVYPNRGWPHGAYRFDFAIDGRRVTCTGSLPFPSCDAADITCDGEGVSLTVSGCALPPSEHSFAGFIGFDGYPREVVIDASLDGKSVAHARFEPRYEAFQPNGPGCDMVCCGAGGDFTLALP